MNNYLYLKIEGLTINRFLLKCYKNNINIIRINYNSYKSITILINQNDYKKISKYIGSNKITIINKRGLNKYKDIINKYKIFILSITIGLLLLIILSSIIFSINIITDNTKLKSIIKKELENYDIKKYSFKKGYKRLNDIKNNIKEKYKDNIEWIEIKEYGTKIEVNIVERKVEKNTIDNQIYAVVAKRDAIIKNIFVEDGISLVEKNNYVKKGDILISSDIYLNEELKKQISANGKVYGETWYKVNVEFPLNYKEIKYTNNKRKIPYIKLGNNYYELFKYNKYKRKEIIKYNDNINFEIGLEEINEIINIDKNYTLEEAKEEAIKYAKNKMKERLKEGEYIISQKTLNFSNKGSKIIVEVFFSVYEEIGEKRIIEMGEAYDTKHIEDGIQ